MRAIETAAIASGMVTGLALMERAGAGTVAAALAAWPELAGGPQRAVVLCGPGNNGGDGLVVARLLRDRGWDVRVFLYGDPARLPPDARANLDRWTAGGGQIVPLAVPEVTPDQAAACAEAARGAALLVDALFGIGLSRPLTGLRPLFAALPPRDPAGLPHRVAIDIPSGIDADSGRVLSDAPGGPRPDDAFAADLTVTFHAPKPAHRIAAALCGRVAVVDIGLPRGPC